MAAKDRAIVLDVSVDTKEAQKAMQQMEKATKQFANVLSHSTRPSRELQQSFKSLNKVAAEYSKVLSQLNASPFKKQKAAQDVEKSALKESTQLQKNIEQTIQRQASLEEKLAKQINNVAKAERAVLEAKQKEAQETAILNERIKQGEKAESLLDTWKRGAIPKKLTDQLTDMGITAAEKKKDVEKQITDYINQQKDAQKLLNAEVRQAETSLASQQTKYENINRAIEGNQQRLVEFSNLLENLPKTKQEDLDKIFGAINAEDKENVERLVNLTREYLTLLGQAKKQAAFDNIKKAVSTLIKDFQKLIQTVRKFISFIGKITGAKNIFKRFNPLGDNDGADWKRAIRYVIQYGLGFRSLFFLVRKLRTTFVSALEDMGKSIPQVQKSLDSLSVSMNTLRGGLAVAFAPLLKYVAALMERLAAVAISAANAIAQFFAVITGQKTWYKLTKGVSGYTDATKGSTKATKENEKEMKKQLAAFDDIDVLVQDLNDDLDDVGGGGGGGADLSEMGVWQAMANASSELAELIKEAWASDDVLHAFETVGRYIGDALKKALDTLLTDFWPGIQALAEKVASAIAGTINGFFKTPGLAQSLAKNIAAMINTALGFLANLWGGIDWGVLGKFIYDSLSTLFNSDEGGINWTKLGEYLGSKIRGLIKFAFNAVGDGGWIRDLAAGLGTTITTVFKKMFEEDESGKSGFAQLGETINTALHNVLVSIKTWIDEHQQDIQDAFKQFWETLNIDELANDLLGVLWSIFKTGLGLLWETITGSSLLSEIIILWLGIEFAKIMLSFSALSTLLGAMASTSLAGALTTAATGALGLIGSFTGIIAIGIPLVLCLMGIIEAMNLSEGEMSEYNQSLLDGTLANSSFASSTQTEFGKAQDAVSSSTGAMRSEMDKLGAKSEETTSRMSTGFGSFKDKTRSYLLDSSGVGGAIDTHRIKVDEVTDVTQTDTQAMISYWEEFAKNYGLDLDAMTELTDIDYTNIKDYISTYTKEAEENSVESMDAIQKKHLDTATKAQEYAIRFGNAFKKMAQDVANAASAIASTPIKPIIDTSSIDAGISKLNTFLSLASRAGSVNVSVSGSIPKMASGGVIPPNKPFLAMLGDQTRGTNVEAPLDTIVTAMKEALGSTNYRASTGEVVLQLDGVTLARATVPYELDELNRKGYNVKVLEK